MSMYNDNSLSIGNTPLIRLNRMIPDKKSKIYVKTEGRNPSYSVKCRVGAALIHDARKSGKLKAGMEIIEPTSGNTGIALAYVAAAQGYKLTLTMPESMSIERRKILKALGANIILTEAAGGMKAAILKAEEMLKSDPLRYFLPAQFSNPSNPAIHERTTAPEIWKDTAGKIDILIAGVGTGGTITGISRYIKKKRKIISIAVEPENSPVITQTLNRIPITPGPHKIQGIGAGFIPDNLDLSLIDYALTVSDDEAFDYARRLAKEEGILSGISGGAAVAAAVRTAESSEHKGKMIVVILPDSAERYLSTPLFEELPDD